METIKQQKTAKLIKTNLSLLFQKEYSYLCKKSLITITVVRASPDLSLAKVYMSIFGKDNKNEILNNFNIHAAEIRFLLGKRIRNQVRHVPHLHFYIDDSLDYIEKIDNALKGQDNIQRD